MYADALFKKRIIKKKNQKVLQDFDRASHCHSLSGQLVTAFPGHSSSVSSERSTTAISNEGNHFGMKPEGLCSEHPGKLFPTQLLYHRLALLHQDLLSLTLWTCCPSHTGGTVFCSCFVIPCISSSTFCSCIV